MSFISKRLKPATGPNIVAFGWALGVVTLGLGSRAAPIDVTWRALWEEDLRVAQHTAEERHPNLFHALSRDAWEHEFDTLIARLDGMEHHAIAVELARIFARLHDGHTRLTLPLGPGIEFMQGHSTTPDPHVPELRFHQYPVRFAIDAQGVYVQRIAAKHRRLGGGRVLRLGHLTIDAAMDAVAPTVRRDNALQLRHHLPMHLVLAEVLHARGVTESMHELAVEVERLDGRVESVTLRRVAHGGTVKWADARDDASAPTPLYLQHPERRYWMTHLADANAAYLQFNEVYNEEDELLREFAARITRFIGENAVDNLIIDLRHNRGGNAALSRPLLRAIVSSPVNRTGHLFVLIGRATFSAAMMFALDLEEHTNALFVGEPTGSSPNHYGDSRKTRLPHTGLTLRVSTLYWQYDPTDVRDALYPHIPVELDAEDYRNNRDPVLDTVLDLVTARTQANADAPGEARFHGTWSGYTTPGLNWIALSLDVSGPTSAPDVRVRVPDLDVDMLASDVALEASTLRFVIHWRDEPMPFSGKLGGDWLVGDGDFRSVYFPFVLRREATTAASRPRTPDGP